MAPDQRIVAMAGLAGLLDTHTQFFSESNERIFIASVYRFPEGLFVVAADDQSLVGSRLLAVDGTPVEMIEPRIRVLIPGDNESARTMLRRLLRRDSNASRIAKAIAKIRDDLAEPLSVPALARVATMSASTFHQHFKAVTATTALQYQKSLRLIEARRRIKDEGRTVTEAAFEVGYQSSTQFSREYARTFGVTPREDRPSSAVAR
jgi:AraC-like DNA-binding protein